MIAGACTGLVPLEALVTLSIVLNDLIPVCPHYCIDEFLSLLPLGSVVR